MEVSDSGTFDLSPVQAVAYTKEKLRRIMLTFVFLLACTMFESLSLKMKYGFNPAQCRAGFGMSLVHVGSLWSLCTRKPGHNSSS